MLSVELSKIDRLDINYLPTTLQSPHPSPLTLPPMLKVIDSFKLWYNIPVANAEPGGYYPTVMDRAELLNDIAARLDD